MQDFSIITPSYNQESFIKETIDSVISQEADVEYMVIDGGSNDGSADLIKSYEKQLSFWVSEKDNGQSHAINKGLKRATGRIANWLNSDDFYLPGALEYVKSHFNESITGLGATSELFNSKGIIKQSRGTDVYPGNLPKTIGWARIDQPETFFSKESWDKVGLLNEDLHYCMDREWWMRYLYEFGLDSFKRVEKPIVRFRIHDDSKTFTSQPSFLKEHHSLFYKMGLVAEYKEATNFMKDHLDLNEDLETAISGWKDRDLALSSFNYYLLKTGEEFYAKSDFETAKKFLLLVKQDLLAPADGQILSMLSKRLKMPSLVKLLRRK